MSCETFHNLLQRKSDFDIKLRIFTSFGKPLFEVKKFYAWKCVNSRQDCSRQLFRVPIGKFHTWLNIFTQPAVVMVVANMRCYQHFRLRKYLFKMWVGCRSINQNFIEIKHLLFLWHFWGFWYFYFFDAILFGPKFLPNPFFSLDHH